MRTALVLALASLCGAGCSPSSSSLGALLDAGATAPPGGPWPMFGHDAGHRRRSSAVATHAG